MPTIPHRAPESDPRPWGGPWGGRRSSCTAILAFLALGAAELGCRYRIGSPPPAVGLSVGEVQVPVAEPAVGDALEDALGAAIRRCGAAGERALTASVVRADFDPVASREGAVLSWEASLGVRFVLLGADPRELELERSMLVATPAGSPPDPVLLRAPAFADLAAILADEAVSFFLYAPQAEHGESR